MNFKDSSSSVFEAQFFHIGHRLHFIISLTDVPNIRLLQTGLQPSNNMEDHPRTYVFSKLNMFKIYVAFYFSPQLNQMRTCSSVKTTSYKLSQRSHMKEPKLYLTRLQNHYTRYSIIQSITRISQLYSLYIHLQKYLPAAVPVVLSSHCQIRNYLITPH